MKGYWFTNVFTRIKTIFGLRSPVKLFLGHPVSVNFPSIVEYCLRYNIIMYKIKSLKIIMIIPNLIN